VVGKGGVRPGQGLGQGAGRARAPCHRNRLACQRPAALVVGVEDQLLGQATEHEGLGVGVLWTGGGQRPLEKAHGLLVDHAALGDEPGIPLGGTGHEREIAELGSQLEALGTDGPALQDATTPDEDLTQGHEQLTALGVRRPRRGADVNRSLVELCRLLVGE
jgi:hypothetical protein